MIITMGIFDTLLGLVALGAGAYVTVYYVLPMMQQSAYMPYYFASAMQQQQQPAPVQQYIPPPATTTTDDTSGVEGDIADTTGTEEESLSDQIAEGIQEGLEGEEGGDESVAAADEELSGNEKEEARSKKAEEDLKKRNKEQKKKREKYDKDTDPKKDSRYKGLSSKEAGKKAAKALGLQTIIYPRSRPYKPIGIDSYGNIIQINL